MAGAEQDRSTSSVDNLDFPDMDLPSSVLFWGSCIWYDDEGQSDKGENMFSVSGYPMLKFPFFTWFIGQTDEVGKD